jgi:hypothetical protein
MQVLYKDYSFRPYQLTNMAATGKSEDFLEIDQSKTGITCGSHVYKWIKTK